jgi:uncharacterized protein (DUF1810 family)/uncharacterized protein YndB with AHSA1/START domain
MYSTRVTRHIKSSPPAVYRTLLNPDAVARWRVPDGMTCEVHEFDGREGGAFRISLSYDSPDGVGKTSAHTDTYHGHFIQLVPDELVVEVLEFETTDPALTGTMTITTTLTAVDGGTAVLVFHEGVPDVVPPQDNEAGARMGLENLARLVEQGDAGATPEASALDRFVAAQDSGGTYTRAVGELRAGRKETHWMWFVFPQISGLGHSSTAKRFALASITEARASLAHPVLGPRLLECAIIVAETPGASAEDVFGPVDAMKLRSSMTLFMRANPDHTVFQRVLDRFFGGIPDPATDRLLSAPTTDRTRPFQSRSDDFGP